MVYEERTFINDQQTSKLLEYFEINSNQKREEKQIIYDYHTEGNFRLVKTSNYVKIDFKPNSAIEKENQVLITKQYENDLIEIFQKIGLDISLKRFRIRHQYIYHNLFISIDDNVKTGNVFRVKFHYKDEFEKEAKLEELNKIFNNLSIEKTDISKFQDLYAKYRMDWYDLTKEIDEEEFLK